MKKYNFILIMLLIIIINMGCDQGTKYYARENFKGRGRIEVIDNFFIIRYTENKGAFLGMGSQLPGPFHKAMLLYLPILLLAGMVAFVLFNSHLSIYEAACMACIIGGGMSNLIDRIIFDGRVTDFLNFGIGSIRTGILNLADISITFGALALILFYIKRSKKPVME